MAQAKEDASPRHVREDEEKERKEETFRKPAEPSLSEIAGLVHKKKRRRGQKKGPRKSAIAVAMSTGTEERNNGVSLKRGYPCCCFTKNVSLSR